MARNAAIVFTWIESVPGREAQSLTVLNEALSRLRDLATKGNFSHPEVYSAWDNSVVMAMIKGPSDKLFELRESDEARKLIDKLNLSVAGLRINLYYGGTDEEVEKGLQMYQEASTELGLL